MGNYTLLQKRSTGYYFRQKIPLELRKAAGIREFVKSLGTKDKKEAVHNCLDDLLLETGAIYLMDRGYLDFARLYRFTQAGAFFVTRAKHNTQMQRVISRECDKTGGVLSDQEVLLSGHYARKDYPMRLRRVRFKDPNTDKVLVFLTNHFLLPADTIAALYKKRWQVELFFKWIKHHLRIKAFVGESENAVKTQI